MKKNVQKLLALVLATIMVFGLVACAQTNNDETDPQKTTQKNDGPAISSDDENLYYNKTGYPICDETITINVAGMVGSTTEWDTTYLVQWVEENLGIKMVCEEISADAAPNRYMQWMSDPTSMPDLVINSMGAVSRSQVDADGKDGYWVDFSKYMDLMPNLYDVIYNQYPALGQLVTNPDGSVYSLTRITTATSSKINSQICYHIPTLEAAGVNVDEIKTIDDFYNALVKVKKAYPDKTPFLITPDAEPAYRNELNLRTAFGVYSNDNSYMVVQNESGEVELADISDNYREYLKFMNKLANEGLIDITDFGKTADELRAATKEGKYVFFNSGVGEYVDPITEEEQKLQANGDYSWLANYGVFGGFTSDLADESVYIANNGVLNQARMYINSNSQYIEAICRLLDYFCTEEGVIMALNGKEGETFDWVEDEQTGLKNCSYDNYWDSNAYDNASEWAKQEAVIWQGFAFEWALVGSLDTLTDAQLAAIPVGHPNYWTAQRLMSTKSVDDFRFSDAAPVYTPEQTERMGSLQTDLRNYLVSAKVQFMAGQLDPNNDADWSSFVETVNGMGWESTLKQIEKEARG